MAAAPARGSSGAQGLLSIGQVLARLESEFPALTSSKLRFLEVQGIVRPRRTESGYRKFAQEDLERLRLALTLQRDHYLPLQVIREYLDDIGRVWDELLILPKQVESRGPQMLVRGRVYLRSHELGIRDMPAAWIWEIGGDRFVRGEVFVDDPQPRVHFS